MVCFKSLVSLSLVGSSIAAAIGAGIDAKGSKTKPGCGKLNVIFTYVLFYSQACFAIHRRSNSMFFQRPGPVSQVRQGARI